MNIQTLTFAFAANTIFATSAFSHAVLEVKEAKADSYYKAVIQIGHGCSGAPTQKVHVTIPEGVISVKPMPKAGWELETVSGDYAHTYTSHGREITSGVKEITWTGSLEDGHYDEFIFRAKLTDSLPSGKNLYFPTVQECAEGENAWVEIPAEGADSHSVAHPAPALMIMAANDDHADHHGHQHGEKDMNMADVIKVGDLEIMAPTARATPEGAPVAGGYLTVKNTGSEADRLIAGSADFAGMVEIHEMKMEGDVMKMRPLPEGLEIPAGGEVVLKPGGYHVMFMKMKDQLKAGETRKVTLTFKNAGDVTLDFKVKDLAEIRKSLGGMDHSKMDHSKMDHGNMDHNKMGHDHKKDN